MNDFAISGDPELQAQLDRLARLPLPQGGIGLEVIQKVLLRLGDPRNNLPPVFHVAGTNGKGSTTAFLRAILEAEGLSVHATTSPHLVRYNERIRIGGSLIKDQELASLLREVLDASEDLNCSFFEMTIAASLLAFSRHPADACIIEVGLGGRLDATNIFTSPAACGVASLGIDHERFLLNYEPGAPTVPIARIAWEKANIARPGVPLVTQAYDIDAEEVIINLAEELGAPLIMRGRDWWVEVGDSIAYRDRYGELTLPLPVLAGAHQADNATLAVAMLRHQQQVTVTPEAIVAGIRAAHWPARLQLLGNGPLAALTSHRKIWLDGGHNRDAGVAIARYFTGHPPLHLIIGMLANKDPAAIIVPLSEHLLSVSVVPVPGHDAHLAEEFAAQTSVPVQGFANVEEALRALPTQDDVLIVGSLYLAGEVLLLNQELPD